MIEILLVAMLAGFVQGLSGFAFGLVATSLWAWMLAPQMLVPMTVLGSLIGQLTSIHGVRADVRVGRVAPFLLGGVIGVPLGVLILHSLNVAAFRVGVGVALVAYCSVMLSTKALPLITAGGRLADCGVGFIAGVMGGVSGLSGPPITLWCSMRGWDKGTQRATFQAFFIGTQLLTLGLFVWHGMVDRHLLRLFVYVAPVVVLSASIGTKLAKRWTDAQFRQLLFALLWLSGMLLLLPHVTPYLDMRWLG